MTGVPDTAHHDGLRTAVRRVLWVAGLLLGLWFLFWIIADEARADGLPVHIPVVDQVVQPTLGTVGKAVEPVGKVVQGLEKGPAGKLLKPIVDALPAPLPGVVAPVLKPPGSSAGAPATPVAPSAPTPRAPAKVKPVATKTTPQDATKPAATTTETSVRMVTRNDFALTAVAETAKTAAPVTQPARESATRHVPATERPDPPVEPGSAPATAGSGTIMAAVVGHEGTTQLTAPGRLIRPHGVFAPLWRSLKPGMSPG